MVVGSQVYQNNNLLRGKTITSAGKANSQYPAFVFKSGLEAPNYVTDWQSYQDSQSVSGMQAATESAEGYTSVSASVSSPWVSASADTAGCVLHPLPEGSLSLWAHAITISQSADSMHRMPQR